MSFRNCHLLVGGVGLLLFLLQGQYMAHVLGVDRLLDGPRMMYRSAHIYFLLSCVANVVIGYAMSATAQLNYLQRLIGVILLACPALLLISFFTESTVSSLDRPISKAALYSLFGSAVILLLHEAYRRRKAGQNRPET